MDKDLLLDKFLQNTLSDSDLIEFEKLKRDDPNFNKEVELAKNIVEGIRLNELEEKMSMLKGFEQQSGFKKEETKVIPLFRNRRILSIAASFIILAGIGLWVFQDQSNGNVYVDYYTFLPATEVVRGDDNPYQQALGLYNSKNFAQAERLLQNNNVPRAYFYRGICMMELDNFQKAVSLFDQYIKKKEGNGLPGEYYLALCFIKLKDINKAKNALNLVSDTEPYYYNKAQELLLKL